MNDATSQPQVPVYILAGGQSSRFGSDKARAKLWGRTLLEHVVESIEPYAATVTVVAERDGSYDDLGLRTIGDIEPGGGPVGGLVTAMRDCDAPWLLLTACDLVGIQPAWIETLLARRHSTERAVCYRNDRWQPMLSMWRTSLIELVERAVMRGDDSMQGLLDEAAALALDVPDGWPERPGVNTPEDLERFT